MSIDVYLQEAAPHLAWLPDFLSAEHVGFASTNALVRPSTISSSLPTSCCSPSSGVCATSSDFAKSLSSCCSRGCEVSHETIRNWEFRFAPMVSERLRAKRRGNAGRSWYLDETYVKVSGRWCYLYRAIDRDGNLLDSMLSEHRDRQAARRFLRRPCWTLRRADRYVLTTDKHPAYNKAVRWIVGRKVLHRQNQYLNNRIEQDHRPLKQRYYPMLGFGQFDSASRFCTAFDELRHYLRVRNPRGERVSASRSRQIFSSRWSTLMAELVA